MARLTLFNTNVSTEQTLSLVGSSNFFPQDSLQVSFGLPTVSSPAFPISGLMIKEVRYWSTQLTAAELSQHRYSQINPSDTSNAGRLLAYVSLSSGSFEFQNLVSPTASAFLTNNLTLVPDSFDSASFYYDVVKEKVFEKKERTYHTVCPLSTYYLDRYCYSEPLNELVLTVTPVWNKLTAQNDWLLSVLDSPAIDSSILQSLMITWMSSDSILQTFFENLQGQPSLTVPANRLRHESEYEISVTVANEQQTFSDTQSIKFVPSKCTWFAPPYSSKLKFDSPGKKDIQLSLPLKRDPQIDCKKFQFFDQIDSIDFEFMLQDTNEFIAVPPLLSYIQNQTGDIEVNFSAAEQTKLPVFADV